MTPFEHDDKLYLIHIVECIGRIQSYTEEGRDAFLQTQKTQDAVIRNFEIMGEAAKQISEGFRVAHPEVQWKRMAGFRDVLIHDYMGVNPLVVWNIVEREIPRPKPQIEAILSSLP